MISNLDTLLALASSENLFRRCCDNGVVSVVDLILCKMCGRIQDSPTSWLLNTHHRNNILFLSDIADLGWGSLANTDYTGLYSFLLFKENPTGQICINSISVNSVKV